MFVSKSWSTCGKAGFYQLTENLAHNSAKITDDGTGLDISETAHVRRHVNTISNMPTCVCHAFVSEHIYRHMSGHVSTHASSHVPRRVSRHVYGSVPRHVSARMFSHTSTQVTCDDTGLDGAETARETCRS